MVLSGNDLVAYIQQRQYQAVSSLRKKLKLAIVRQGVNASTDVYMRVKKAYGQDLGIDVVIFNEQAKDLIDRIKTLNSDESITGIIVQLPLDDAKLTDEAISTIDINKDVDGLAPNSRFEAATPKAIIWLLAGYNIDLKEKRISIVGQGRLVGLPLAQALDKLTNNLVRLDEDDKNIAEQLLRSDIIISATGRAGLIESEWVKSGAVVIDVGSPESELSEKLRTRDDIKLSPNPGGVGPVTVAALFDNVIIAGS
jgi:methylenetetrahydrofolate dehydrogenase (NADP+) / methenyltetrahydrofolate cyclohydrolase